LPATSFGRLDFSAASADMPVEIRDNEMAETQSDTQDTRAATEPVGAEQAPGVQAAAPNAEALAREVADYKDKVLRTLADMENLRSRTAREIMNARVYSISSFAGDILAVADNMDRALRALDAELREKSDAAVKALLDGVELTERELHKALQKHGVKKFEPMGEKFDPHRHQAMFEVPDPSLPAGTVARVEQPGYMIGERVLRPALVAVAKGGPKPETPANDNAGTPDQNLQQTDPQRSP
jgi:molecular chaperone GrpE